MTDTKETVLDEAKRLVYGDREGDYGHPREDFGCTAALWTEWLRRRGFLDVSLEPCDVAAMMVLLKVSREAHKSKRDNLVDMAGYVATWARVIGEDE